MRAASAPRVPAGPAATRIQQARAISAQGRMSETGLSASHLSSFKLTMAVAVLLRSRALAIPLTKRVITMVREQRTKGDKFLSFVWLGVFLLVCI